MASIATATLITIRDNLVTAYTELSTNSITSYSLGDRSFTYESREQLWNEIERIEKKINLASGRTAGRTRPDLRTWR